MRKSLIVIAAMLWGATVMASEDIADKYPQSALYNKPVEVIPHVWTSIGATAPPTYENAGHNNNLSFIITGEGVVVVNSGASYQLAQALHEEIRARTDQPVRLVIAENGQGHAMLGNNYWIEQDVPVLAHVDAAEEFRLNSGQAFVSLQNYARERSEGTVPMQPTETFTDRVELSMGDFRIEVLHLGPAHSPGDTQVWLPDQSLLIAGDIAFQERMPPIFEGTCTSCWIDTWDNALEPIGATYVIPGHGHPTNMAQVRRYTRDYLVWLRERIAEHIDEGGDLAGAYYVDQSPFVHLDTFEELATRNAGVVFSEMEWE
ncbi:MAG: MBL fold metallo-hydrolase [Rhodobacteraceae bacterium]|nr:MAG: MBL fold metallo-hydrolase [Paracoccaceae bacterium]